MIRSQSPHSRDTSNRPPTSRASCPLTRTTAAESAGPVTTRARSPSRVTVASEALAIPAQRSVDATTAHKKDRFRTLPPVTRVLGSSPVRRVVARRGIRAGADPPAPGLLQAAPSARRKRHGAVHARSLADGLLQRRGRADDRAGELHPSRSCSFLAGGWVRPTPFFRGRLRRPGSRGAPPPPSRCPHASTRRS